MVGQRWLKSYQSKDMFDQSTLSVSDGDVDTLSVQENQVHVSAFNSECKLTGMLARNQKFRKMQSLCQKLAVIASECGMPQYREKHSQVSRLIDLWEGNIPAVVCAASDPEVRCVCV